MNIIRPIAAPGRPAARLPPGVAVADQPRPPFAIQGKPPGPEPMDYPRHQGLPADLFELLHG